MCEMNLAYWFLARQQWPTTLIVLRMLSRVIASSNNRIAHLKHPPQ